MIQSADEILQRVQDDAALMGLLGRYHFRDGGLTKALVILSSSEEVPGMERVEGLELVISRTPETTAMQLIAGCPPLEKTWTLYLIQYEGSPHHDQARMAADRISQMCPGATYSSVGGGFSEVAGLEQIVVKLRNPLFLDPFDPQLTVMGGVWDGGDHAIGDDAAKPWSVYDGGEMTGG